MALLRISLAIAVITSVVLITVPVSSFAHSMGRSIPIAVDSELPTAALAGNIVAAYFEEQMGREMVLLEKTAVQEILQQIIEHQAPMAVVPVLPREQIPESVVIVLPGLDTGEGIFTLAMGIDARKELQFSLVPQYMEKLSEKLTHDTWKKGIDRVKAGEGIRKVALDMLREGDLI